MCMGQVVFLINRTRFAKTILLPFYILARSHHRKTVTDWRVTLDIFWTVRCAKTFRSDIYHFSVKLLSTHILYAKPIEITHPCHDPPPLLFTPCLSIPYNTYFTSEPQYRNIVTDWRVTLDICWTVRCAKTFRSDIYHFSVKLLSTHILYAKLIKITHPCHDP